MRSKQRLLSFVKYYNECYSVDIFYILHILIAHIFR